MDSQFTEAPRMNSLARKIAEVYVALNRLSKNAEIESDTGTVKAVAAADVFDAARTELGQRGVIIFPDPQSFTFDAGLGRIVVNYELVDADSDQVRLISNIEGYSVDKGDKGYQKAFTAATKTMLTHLLLISSGDPQPQPAETRASEQNTMHIITARITQVREETSDGESYFKVWFEVVGNSASKRKAAITKLKALAQHAESLIGAYVQLELESAASRRYDRLLRITVPQETQQKEAGKQ